VPSFGGSANSKVRGRGGGILWNIGGIGDKQGNKRHRERKKEGNEWGVRDGVRIKES